MQSTIVLVEGDVDLRYLLVDKLTRQGADVVGIGSVLEFYQKMSKYRFDVAVLDMGLPDYSGISIAKYIKKEAQQIGVIILSTSHSSEDKVKAYESGADLYITKPVDSKELFLAIQNLVSRLKRVNLKSKNNNDMWFVDKESWRITAPCNYNVELSGKEMVFISILGKQVGSAVRRKDLLQEMNYPDSQHGHRALESMVLRLRKKLAGSESGHSPVKTVHGVGYVFSLPLTIK